MLEIWPDSVTLELGVPPAPKKKEEKDYIFVVFFPINPYKYLMK